MRRKEKEAWEFFEQNCDFNNREEMKNKVKAVLRKDSVYNFSCCK